MTRTALVLALVILMATPAFAKTLPNGSFEDTTGGTAWVTSIQKWTLTPSTTVSGQNAGIFFKIDGFGPDDGSSYAVLTTNNDRTQILSSSTFTIDNERLEFAWVYVTNNTPGDATHKDPFTVTLTTTGNLGNTNTTWTVSNVDDSSLKSGSVGISPWGLGTTYDSQKWQTFTIDTTSLQGQTATLLFTMNDSATGGGVSGVFLDDVAHLPEPGTFLLFGVGLVGLAFYGRRKLRR